jgi:hypothetical protein
MMNEALGSLLSVSLDVAGKTPIEVVRSTAVDSAIQRVLLGGKTEAFEMEIPVAGGKTLEINIVAIPSTNKHKGSWCSHCIS